MIEILEKSDFRLTIKYQQSKRWIGFITCLAIVIIISCQFFSIFPISSSLICSKNWLNQTNCKIVESSLFEPNFKYQVVHNINKPKGVEKDGAIWLDTKVDLFHNQIQNIYYPSHNFIGLLNIYLYRFYRQSLKEANKITEYVRDRDTQATLTLTRKRSLFFYISFLLLPLIIMYPVSIIILPPTQTYEFNLQQKYLVTKTKIMFGIQENKYPFDNLKIESSSTTENRKDILISLYVDNRQLFTCDHFENEREAVEIINLLKQHIL